MIVEAWSKLIHYDELVGDIDKLFVCAVSLCTWQYCYIRVLFALHDSAS